MSIINYHGETQVLVSVKGHPYARDAFFDMFENMEGIAYTAVEQPASQVFFDPGMSEPYDALVLYDMPGLDFSVQPPEYVAPPASFRAGFIDMLERGQGCVFLHHAIAGWPAWEEYAEIVGGRFLYRPGRVRGEDTLDSGYRHAVPYRASVLEAHPVTEGIEPEFDITDELYLCEVFEDDIIPLLASDYHFDRDHFYSAFQAATGRMFSNEGWVHSNGSNIIGWVKHYGNSPIVYLQSGDDTDAYNHPQYRRLLENAIRWVASEEARQWARARNGRG